MVDPLVTKAELETLIGQTLDDTKAMLLLTTASGVVRGAVGQTLSQVVGDTATLMGDADFWLELPERPVTTVTSVTLDGTVLTSGVDYRRFGTRLRRRGGWATCPGEPSEVEVVYTHGWAPGAWELETARSMVMTLAANKIENALGAESESVDDYRIRYAVTATDLSEHARQNLIDAYGAPAGEA